MQAIIHAADIQDRDGGVLLMGALFGLYPFLLDPTQEVSPKSPSGIICWPGIAFAA